MIGFDDNELVAFPTGNVINRNLLFNFSFFYEFFHNARVGYNVLSSYDIGRLEGFKTSKPVFYRTINYRMIPLETFFRIKPKVELNFTLTPIWGRGKITLETKPSSSEDGAGYTITDDWNELLNGFGDENIDYITMEFYKSLFNGPLGAVQNLIRQIHFHSEHPENWNVKITNDKTNKVQTLQFVIIQSHAQSQIQATSR